MRKTLGVCLLVLLLTSAPIAGEMPNGSPAPPSQPTSAVQEPADDTHEPTADGIMPNDEPDTLTQIALELLATLPSLL